MKVYQSLLDKPVSVKAGPRTRGGYYCERPSLDGPAPTEPRTDIGGYLGSKGTRLSNGAPCALRVFACHDYKYQAGRALIDHQGWYTDDDGCGDLIYGIVARLPSSRGYLAGWSMGEGMCATLSLDIHDTERDAVYAADNAAQCAAEQEREYQRKWQAAREIEDARETIAAARLEHSALARELRAARKAYGGEPMPHVCAAIRSSLRSSRHSVTDAVERIQQIIKDHGKSILGLEYA